LDVREAGRRVDLGMTLRNSQQKGGFRRYGGCSRSGRFFIIISFPRFGEGIGWPDPFDRRLALCMI
jgi:hypothetical protein